MKFLFLVLIFTGLAVSTFAQYKGGSYSGYFSVIDTNAIVGITRISSEADDYMLHQNYPNPFNPGTVINYDIKNAGNVFIAVYDVLGNEIVVLSDQRHLPGKYSVTFDGKNFSSGVYFCKIISGNFSDTKKMLLTK